MLSLLLLGVRDRQALQASRTWPSSLVSHASRARLVTTGASSAGLQYRLLLSACQSGGKNGKQVDWQLSTALQLEDEHDDDDDDDSNDSDGYH